MRPNVRWLLALALAGCATWWWLPATAQSPPAAQGDPNQPPKIARYVTGGDQDPSSLANALTDYLKAVQLKTVEVTPETRQKLTRILGELYDLRQQVQQQELKALEDRLKSLKDQLATRGKDRDATIAKQADAILQGKEPPVALWVPSGLPKLEWSNTDPTAKEPMTTTQPPRNATVPKGLDTFGPPPGQGSKNVPPVGRNPFADQGGIDATIRIGLPDELIGQLLQAKTDKEKALVAMAIQTRMELLQAQIQEAETRLDRFLKLGVSGAIDAASVDQAKARVEQLKVLLRAHDQLRQQARP